MHLQLKTTLRSWILWLLTITHLQNVHKVQRGQKRPKKKLNESAMCVVVHATQEMVFAILKEATILEDASIMALFTLPDEQLVSQEMKKNF